MMHRSTNKKREPRRVPHRKRTYKKITTVKIATIIAIVVIGFAAFSIYLSYRLNSANENPASLGYLGHNLNYTTLGVVIPQQEISYRATEISNISVLSSAFRSSGYVAISVSSFNATELQANAIYPQVISSSIILTENGSDASQTALLAAYQLVNPSPKVLYQNNMSFVTNYTYGTQSVRIYTTQSISALNSSFANVTISPPGPPLNQYVSTFAYGDLAVIVTVNGYSGMESNVSYMLAEKVFQSLVQYKTTLPGG